MKFFNELRKYDTLFFVSLLWLAFPIYYTLKGDYPKYMLLATFLLGIFYLASLVVKNEVIIILMWLYMCSYVIWVVFALSIYNTMTFMYLSALLNYRFKDTNFKSFKNITFFVMLATVLLGIYLRVDVNFFERVIAITLIAICFFMHISTRSVVVSGLKKEEEMKQNNYINNLLTENERNRIGRDLHDTLGHVFAMLTLKSELAGKLIDKGDYKDAKKEILEINNITNNSMNQVRQIVNNLKYRSLKEELANSKKVLDLANISLEINQNYDIEKMAPTEQSTLSMVLRECINNVLKHSKASACKLNFLEEDKKIIFEIEDNGEGFKKILGNELDNIKERMGVVKGNIRIIGLKNPTKIRIEIPRGGD